MKKLILSALLLLSHMGIAQDLPTTGGSVFDKIFSENGQYNVPRSLRELAKKIKSYDISLHHSFLSFGRSRQGPFFVKGLNPWLEPRIVLATSTYGPWELSGKLFLGYLEKTDELEVISFNEEMGRFEFQRVFNFTNNKKPLKVRYAQRKNCISCHKNEGPIFSVNSWTDTNDDNVMIRNSVEEAERAEKEKNPDYKTYIERFNLTGISSQNNRGVDESAELASNWLSLQNLWMKGCSSSECRRAVILNLLASSDKGLETMGQEDWEKSQIYNKEIFSNGIAAPIYLTDTTLEDMRENNIEKVLSLYTESELPQNAKPYGKYPRKLSEWGTSFSLLGLSTPTYPFVYTKDELLAAQEIVKENESLFKENKALIKNEFLEKLGIKIETLSFPKVLPKPVLNNNQMVMPVYKSPILRILARNCFSCHGLADETTLDFMVGTEEEVLNLTRKHKSDLLEVIADKDMPPSKEDLIKFVESKDRKKLLELLREL